MITTELPTPALLLDADIFEKNIALMAAHAGKSGKRLRPHAKAHKCAEVARRQIAAGAVGVCAATVAEAEYLIAEGIRGVLLTSPITEISKALRIARLSKHDETLTVVVDHQFQVLMYQRTGAELNVLVDIDLGDHRTGIAPGEPALALAKLVNANLQFKGFQAYSVRGSHENGFEERSNFSRQALAPAAETRRRARAEVLTGGSTGTYNIDSQIEGFTELQAGSYVFMDLAYRKIGVTEFGNALTVLATVVSASHADRVTVDAGFKAFATDRPFGPEALDIRGVRYEWAGDEFGFVHLDSPSRELRLGNKIRFIPPHCDPTVNLYDRIYVHRGERVEDVWPIMGRVRI